MTMELPGRMDVEKGVATGLIGRILSRGWGGGGWYRPFFGDKAPGRRTPKRLVDYLGRDVSILDAGCGAASDHHLIREVFESEGKNARTKGVDKSEEVLRMVKEGIFHYEKISEMEVSGQQELELLKGYAENCFEEVVWGVYRMKPERIKALDLEKDDIVSMDREEKYDIILNIWVMPHLESDDQQKALGNMLGHLKDGGFFVSEIGIYRKIGESIELAYAREYGSKIMQTTLGEFEEMRRREILEKHFRSEGYEVKS